LYSICKNYSYQTCIRSFASDGTPLGIAHI
jgi:hypothetical protein